MVEKLLITKVVPPAFGTEGFVELLEDVHKAKEGDRTEREQKAWHGRPKRSVNRMRCGCARVNQPEEVSVITLVPLAFICQRQNAGYGYSCLAVGPLRLVTRLAAEAP
jgi:hypothetical protein